MRQLASRATESWAAHLIERGKLQMIVPVHWTPVSGFRCGTGGKERLTKLIVSRVHTPGWLLEHGHELSIWEEALHTLRNHRRVEIVWSCCMST